MTVDLQPDRWPSLRASWRTILVSLAALTLLAGLTSPPVEAQVVGGDDDLPQVSPDSIDFAYTIDESLSFEPTQIESYGGRSAPVAATKLGTLPTTRFVADELIILSDDTERVKAFAESHGGEVVLRSPGPPDADVTTMNVVRVDPSQADLSRLEAKAERLLREDSLSIGQYRISSERGARLLSILADARLDGLKAYRDVLGHTDGVPTKSMEAPTHEDGGGFYEGDCGASNVSAPSSANAWTWQNVNWADEPKIGVPEAWSLAQYHGHDPSDDDQARIAIHDRNFCFPDGMSSAAIHDKAESEFPEQYARFDPLVYQTQVEMGRRERGTTDFPNLTLCSQPGDQQGATYHGTKVASVALAQSGNEYGAVGTSGGFTGEPHVVNTRRNRVSEVRLSLYATAAEGADIVNMSWGYVTGLWDDWVFGVGVSSVHDALRPPVEYLRRNGVLLVASAGNGDLDDDCAGDKVASSEGFWRSVGDVFSVDIRKYPCVLPEVTCVGGISVSRTDSQGRPVRHPKSNYEEGVVDISAPYQMWYGWNPEDPAENLRRYWSGTSASAPYVAGVASLLWSIHPDPSPQAITDLLYETARPAAYGDEMRHGHVCALCAVEELLEDRPPEVEFTEGSQHDGACYETDAKDLEFAAKGRDVRDFLHRDSPNLNWTVNGAPFALSRLPESSTMSRSIQEWRVESFTRTFEADRFDSGTKSVTVSMEDSDGQVATESVEFEIYHGKLQLGIVPAVDEVQLPVRDDTEWPFELRATAEKRTCASPQGQSPQRKKYQWASDGTVLGTDDRIELNRSFLETPSGGYGPGRTVTLAWTGPDDASSDEILVTPCARSRDRIDNVNAPLCDGAKAEFVEQMRDVFREINRIEDIQRAVESIQAELGNVAGGELSRRVEEIADNGGRFQNYAQQLVDYAQSDPSSFRQRANALLSQARVDDQVSDRDLRLLHHVVEAAAITEWAFSPRSGVQRDNPQVLDLLDVSTSPGEAKSRIMIGAMRGYFAGIVMAEGTDADRASHFAGAMALRTASMLSGRESGGEESR